MNPVLTASCAVLLLTTACAPVVQGRAAIALPPGLQETAQPGAIILSTDWVNAGDDFPDTVAEEMREELSLCMHGTAPVDIRIHVEDLDRAGRLNTLLNGGGRQSIRAVVEFVDPARRRIVGRVPMEAAVEVGGGLAGLLADRQMLAAEALGRAVCDEAFGRNPRPPRLSNATAD